MNHAFGVVQWLAADVLGTTYTVNLPAGFDLKALRTYWVGIQSATDALIDTVNGHAGTGFAVGTASQRAIDTVDFDNNTSNPSGCAIRNDCVVVTANSDGTTTGKLSVTTFSAEQIVFTVDDVAPSDITVGWDAWGGSDITVAAVGDFAEPAATGTQTYTVTGFTSAGTDQVVMLAGGNQTAALNSAHDIGSCLYVGYTTGASENIVVVGNSQDAAPTSVTDGYCKTGECLALIPSLGGHPDARAKLSAWATDGFTLDWLERTTTGRKSIFLAIKGGQWKAGAYGIDGTTLSATATVSGLAFAPIGLDLIGRMTAEQTVDVATPHKRFSFGSASSTTSRQSMGIYVPDAAAVSDINLVIQYDQVLCYPSGANALLAAYDINAMNSDGFQVIVDVAGGVSQEWQGYLAFASAASELAPQSRIVNASFAVTRASSY